MLLTIDIGNTNIVLGTFSGNRLIGKQRILSNRYARVKLKGPVDAAVIGSVVPRLTGPVASQIRRRYKVKPYIVSLKDIDVKIALKKRDQIGIDRLINVMYVVKKYGYPAIVIDFGTATTFCALDKHCVYRGGAITSGLAISRDVLHERTAKLPLINIVKPAKVIGSDTGSAMRSGLFYGYVEMVEGMIRRFKKELGSGAKVIATGGLSKLISSGTDKIDVVDPDLTLKGLNMIYREKVKTKSYKLKGKGYKK